MTQNASYRQPHLRPEMTLALLNERIKGYLPDLVGMEFTAVAPGKLNGRLTVRRDLMAPNGFLHAATVIALADTACGVGTFAHLPEGADSFTTVELKTNFLSTLREGVITCEANLVHYGRTLQIWDAVVADEANGQKIALFRCTQMILWPKS